MKTKLPTINPMRIENVKHWRTVFFAINFGGAVIFILVCIGGAVGSVVNREAPFALIGGIVFLVPATAILLAERRLYIRHTPDFERLLGIVYGWVAGLAIWAVVANASEAIRDHVKNNGYGGAKFWLIFGGTCLSIASYSGMCCWFRVNHCHDHQEPHGFPVKQMEKDSPEPKA